MQEGREEGEEGEDEHREEAGVDEDNLGCRADPSVQLVDRSVGDDRVEDVGEEGEEEQGECSRRYRRALPHLILGCKSQSLRRRRRERFAGERTKDFDKNMKHFDQQHFNRLIHFLFYKMSGNSDSVNQKP